MLFSVLLEEGLHRGPQFGEAAVAFEQFLAGVLVVGGPDQVGDLFTQALERQRDGVFDEVGIADAQLLPVSSFELRVPS